MNRAPFLLAVLIVLSVWAAVPWAYPPETEIQEVVSNPQSYHMHVVTLKGTVSHIEKLPPYPCSPPIGGMDVPPAGEPTIQMVTFQCYGAATFTLEDATGTLPVRWLGTCCLPEVAIHINEGETVIVSGIVMWDHLYPGTVSVNATNLLQSKP
jgi:hypothetical protein